MAAGVQRVMTSIPEDARPKMKVFFENLERNRYSKKLFTQVFRLLSERTSLFPGVVRTRTLEYLRARKPMLSKDAPAYEVVKYNLQILELYHKEETERLNKLLHNAMNQFDDEYDDDDVDEDDDSVRRASSRRKTAKAKKPGKRKSEKKPGKRKSAKKPKRKPAKKPKRKPAKKPAKKGR